jgi:FAD/FMN-containing dehydrogenase
MTLPAGIVEEIRRIVGPEGVLGRAELGARDPGVDPHNLGADLLIRPATTGDVSRVLACCHAARIGVVPQGGRTGLSGGAVTHAGEVIVSLERLNRIESLDPISRTVVLGAGVTLTVLARAASAHELSPGIDFGGRDSATIGGMISTNAGGVAAFRHGTMRERVLGLEVVLADGSVLTELGRVRKHNEGLAVQQLFIGAEGTLGVITRVALALIPIEGVLATALVAIPDLDRAVTLCDKLQRSRTLTLGAIEIMSGNHVAATTRGAGTGEFSALAAAPYVVLVEASSAGSAESDRELTSALTAAAEAGVIQDALVARNEAQRRYMWHVREDWAVDRERPGGCWYDVSVPLAALPSYLASCVARLRDHDASLALYVIGHLADGNVHLTVNAPHPVTDRYEELAKLVTADLVELGGSFSAEHGIGLEKKATLRRLAGSVKLDLMRRIKRALDPHGIMNPGKVVPD